LTLHVGQVEMGREILLTLDDSKDLYFLGAIVFTGLFIISLPIFIWVLIVERKNSRKKNS
jgi:hypothetical protein